MNKYENPSSHGLLYTRALEACNQNCTVHRFDSRPPFKPVSRVFFDSPSVRGIKKQMKGYTAEPVNLPELGAAMRTVSQIQKGSYDEWLKYDLRKGRLEALQNKHQCTWASVNTIDVAEKELETLENLRKTQEENYSQYPTTICWTPSETKFYDGSGYLHGVYPPKIVPRPSPSPAIKLSGCPCPSFRRGLNGHVTWSDAVFQKI